MARTGQVQVSSWRLLSIPSPHSRLPQQRPPRGGGRAKRAPLALTRGHSGSGQVGATPRGTQSSRRTWRAALGLLCAPGPVGWQRRAGICRYRCSARSPSLRVSPGQLPRAQCLLPGCFVVLRWRKEVPAQLRSPPPSASSNRSLQAVSVAAPSLGLGQSKCASGVWHCLWVLPCLVEVRGRRRQPLGTSCNFSGSCEDWNLKPQLQRRRPGSAATFQAVVHIHLPQGRKLRKKQA